MVRVRRRQTVRQGFTNRGWVRSISGGLSLQALTEYLHLWGAVRNIHLNEPPDKTVWRWTQDGKYLAKCAYNMLHAPAIPFLGHRLIWKTWAPLRIKIFLWLAFKRRHWTSDQRARHGQEEREMCYLCDQERETIDHILATCPFTRELWYFILHALGKKPLPQAANSTLRWWRCLRSLHDGDRRSGMDSLFAPVSWQVWKERNARCFRDATATVSELLQLIKTEADRWIEAGATKLALLAES